MPFALPGFNIDQVRAVDTALLVEASATRPTAICPSCQTPSQRVHSRYTRTPRDLPVTDHAVRLRLHVRRFFCDHPSCPKRTFAEPVPDLLPFRAQRTLRLSRTLTVLAFALGGEAGARVSAQLRMPISAASCLRIVRRTTLPPATTPRVLGVDDFALRRGRTYATILVDLEQRRPVDLLPDRTADTLATWLRQHPGVEVIARDRSTEYTRGAIEGAPTAIQVADRWHLLQNLREAVERVLHRNHAHLRQLPVADPAPLPPAATIRPRRIRPVTASEQARQDASRSQRLARYAAVRQLAADGVAQREIARQVHLSRTTVRLFATAETFPERATRRRRTSILDRYHSYLQQRWAEGCSNGSQLWREIRAQGYPGARRHVLRWIQQQRVVPAPTGPTAKRHSRSASSGAPLTTQGKPKPTDQIAALPAPRQLAWTFLRTPSELNAEEQATLTRVQQDPHMMRVYALAQQFQQMVRTRQAAQLSSWLDACATSGVPDLQTFAASLGREDAAIRHALTEPWSTGPVEGHITRVKLVKRQMFGRANFDLLRQRVLNAA
ncbi:MAG TPA: ISL3 family transposase [Gammaproteobacteria bacterium]|nr:ISL3 family transposase [Gammaproteobacteria bacterium]